MNIQEIRDRCNMIVAVGNAPERNLARCVVALCAHIESLENPLPENVELDERLGVGR